ncbi:MAG TPA: hypothetical protein PLR06_11335 [Cyclobacteriaceae bacterium]|nr:hypothetical protein [Cyclobacteriaceae bacterium]
MKNLLIAASFLILIACGQTSEHAGHDMETEGDSPNQALYNQVMDIHDEVMPKMEDLYKYKMDCQDKIANNPNLSADEKKALENTIASLDSANNAMMNWMHGFNPKPDSTDQEAAREYLETEMEKIKKVRDFTNETIEKAKKATGKQ